MNNYLNYLILKIIEFYPENRPNASDSLKVLEKINEYIKIPNK